MVNEIELIESEMKFHVRKLELIIKHMNDRLNVLENKLDEVQKNECK